jgi:hypothetical protein
MTMTGIVKGGVIIPDSPAALVEGTVVRIVLDPPGDGNQEIEVPSLFYRLARAIGQVELPEDFAHNDDHYIHGAPKK